MTDKPEGFRAGFAALVGRPNTGKSSLMNRAVGQKLSIVTPKAQTTRHRILGIAHQPDAQILFLDTPGLHSDRRRRLNQAMNRTASNSLAEADVVVLVVEALRWTEEDAAVLDRCVASGRPLILAINKVDTVPDKERLLPFIDELRGRADLAAVIPVSAMRGDNLDALIARIAELLPVSPPLYPDEQVTDRPMRFIVAEIVREKLTMLLRDELPYGLTVDVEAYEERPDGGVSIAALILVERVGHKGIVIGEGGRMLKEVGTRARRDIEAELGVPVHLKLWVKVRPDWPDDARLLRELGLEEG